MPRVRLLAVVLVLCACLPTGAQGVQVVNLKLRFVPDRPGASTTIESEILITTPAGQVPSPMTHISLHLPRGVGLGGSELGLSTCSIATLELMGPEGCPANALMGSGSALSEVPLGPEVVRQGASIKVFLTQPVHGHTAMLFYANAQTPVSAQIIFPAVLVPASDPRGSAYLNTLVPITPTVPEAPDVSVVRIRTILGPLHLTYYKRVHGRSIPYRPAGIALPAHCPAGGFQFAVTLSFLDGTTATARTTVPCPR
jgi:hypothetical protein